MLLMPDAGSVRAWKLCHSKDFLLVSLEELSLTNFEVLNCWLNLVAICLGN